MMTKKNYEAMAEVFADMIDGNSPNSNANFIAGYARAIGDVAEELADVFAKDNPRFDKNLFLSACNLR